jgi:flagellin
MSLFSVNTNLGALAALQSLDSTQEALNTTQNEISTGQKVSQASDNPAIYSIANTINANIAGLGAVSDSLNFGAQVVATASSAVSNVSTVLQSLQASVTDSQTSGINLTTIQQAVQSDLQSINQYATDASFNGVNLLASTTGNGVTSNSLNVVQSLDGGTYQVGNQINSAGSSANQSLTDTLGLTGLNVSGQTSSTATTNIGANISFGAGTDVFATFDPSVAGGLNTTATPNTDAAIQVTTGTGASAKTTTFEFVDDSQAGNGTSTQLQSAPSASNTVVAVHFDSTKDSTDQIVANLQSALSANGFGVQQQTDGSLNVVGNNISAVDYGTVSNSVNGGAGFVSQSGTGGGAATNGITVGKLSGNQAAVTAVELAVTTLNGISATLGAASQQITGIQNFTTSLSSALTAGVGALTDADLAAESAQLTSLQTKQQLATQSLSIANQQPQSLLSLFKGG